MYIIFYSNAGIIKILDESDDLEVSDGGDAEFKYNNKVEQSLKRRKVKAKKNEEFYVGF